MARIYDNLETKFTDGLQGIISNVGVKRVDFCVGYFNLRGWNLIVNEVDQLSGDFVYEQNDREGGPGGGRPGDPAGAGHCPAG